MGFLERRKRGVEVDGGGGAGIDGLKVEVRERD